MNEEELIELIATRVRARLAAGGVGAGYTQHTAAAASSDTRTSMHSSTDTDVEDCNDCGMCAIPSPGKVEAMSRLGVDRISTRFGHSTPPNELAGYIDHTLLKAEATREDFEKLAAEARTHKLLCAHCPNQRGLRL